MDLLTALECPVVLVDRAGAALAADWCAIDITGAVGTRGRSGPVCAARPDDLAYVMHTSGTTGTPKAVLVTHRGAANFVRWISRAFPLEPGTSVLQWTPTVFDPSVWELWFPLMLGRTSVVAPHRAHADMVAVAELMERTRVATLHFTPATLATFLDTPQAARCRDLRYLFCSGEAIPVALAQRALRVIGAPVVNLYGATEVSVDSTFEICDPVPCEGTVSAGTPIDNTGLYLLDDDLRPVWDGVLGEVYLGGLSVARGYRNRPGLTAARFVPDPFAGPGERMYRTGDLAMRADGRLWVSGRRDGQLKIRGVRIELSGIEAIATEDPSVQACVAVGHGEGALRRVVAYVVGSAGAELDLERVRDSWVRRLPAAAVPASVTVLSELPISPTGKVNRAALPEPVTGAVLADPELAPRTPSEELVARLWCDLLSTGPVGRSDEFVRLGGDSLLATRVITAIERETGVRLPPTSWQSARTVAELADELDNARDTAAAEQDAELDLMARISELSDEDVRRLLADPPY